jgi:hydroxyacylglutathione hydrolase
MILGCEQTKEGVLVDPGAEPEKILERVKALGLDIKYILHTHAHFDHIAGTGGIKKILKAPACLHKADLLIYNNLPMQGRLFGMEFDPAPPVEKFVEDEENIRFGNYELKTIHTPGHSPGSICFELKGGGSLFSGDTLFAQSIGRADLWGGDHNQLIKSIKDRLLVLEDDTDVHPGHGPSTKIGIEKSTNPFLI